MHGRVCAIWGCCAPRAFVGKTKMRLNRDLADRNRSEIEAVCRIIFDALCERFREWRFLKFICLRYSFLSFQRVLDDS